MEQQFWSLEKFSLIVFIGDRPGKRLRCSYNGFQRLLVLSFSFAGRAADTEHALPAFPACRASPGPSQPTTNCGDRPGSRDLSSAVIAVTPVNTGAVTAVNMSDVR